MTVSNRILFAVIILLFLVILSGSCSKKEIKSNCVLYTISDQDQQSIVVTTTSFIRDSQNKIVAKISSINNGRDPGNSIVVYTFDSKENIIQDNQSNVYTYDANNNLIQADHFDYGETLVTRYSYEYNSTNQLSVSRFASVNNGIPFTLTNTVSVF